MTHSGRNALEQFIEHGRRMDDIDAEFEAIKVATMNKDCVYRNGGIIQFAKLARYNRYSNVLPFERTRVKLQPISGEEDSHYINANFISGVDAGADKAYIATQAPVPAAFSSFWRMIWEQNCRMILMLTREVENSRVKADRYWPKTGDKRFGPLIVSFVSQDELMPSILRRRFIIKNGKDEREVVHLLYSAWPDHGVPDSSGPIRELLRLVDADRSQNQSEARNPVVVHCSAGIGRTGVFIAIHKELLKMQRHLAEGNADPLSVQKTVEAIRNERPGMVQQSEQYRFCYLVLVEEAQQLLNQTR